MKERPILFSATMVRALLSGTKTQTRRAVKPQPPASAVAAYPPHTEDPEWSAMDGGTNIVWRARCPYGQSGDRLWVKETWAAPHAHDARKPSEIPTETPIHFAASENLGGLLKRTSLFMPRWASRITLEVTGVRAERLQDISEADANAEGVRHSLHLPGGRFARENYAHLWWTINGDGSWEANPWVWVVEFHRI